MTASKRWNPLAQRITDRIVALTPAMEDWADDIKAAVLAGLADQTWMPVCRNHDMVRATHYCTECQQYLCQRCADLHNTNVRRAFGDMPLTFETMQRYATLAEPITEVVK